MRPQPPEMKVWLLRITLWSILCRIAFTQYVSCKYFFGMSSSLTSNFGNALRDRYSFSVKFPTISSPLDRPHVECITGLPRDSGSCTVSDNSTSSYCLLEVFPFDSMRCIWQQECTSGTPPLCINSFQIITTQVNVFLGIDEPVTVCKPLDSNGNEVDLNRKKFQIVLKAKAPSYNAPTRVVLDTIGNDIQVWKFDYVI